MENDINGFEDTSREETIKQEEPVKAAELSAAPVADHEEPRVIYVTKKRSKAPIVILVCALILALICIAFQSVFIFLLSSGKLERNSLSLEGYIESSAIKSVVPEKRSDVVDPNFSLVEAASVHDPNKKTLSTVEIYDKVSPATVAIYLVNSKNETSAGSGFIITENGYIVTNAHVVESEEEQAIKVSILGYDDTFDAKIVGSDVQTDIAVIKVECDEPLPTVTLGDSDVLQNGELAIAIGNPLGSLQGTITCGVISGVERPLSNKGYTMNLIQTDASVNSGNSGGPLINSFGEVIGVVNAKISSAEGLGFAIPINSVKYVIESIIVNGKVVNRPYLGIVVSYIAEDAYFGAEEGVYVYDMTPGGPGDKAGLKKGDKLISLDGVEIKVSNDIIGIRDSHEVGDEIEVVVERDGKQITLTLEIGDSADFE